MHEETIGSQTIYEGRIFRLEKIDIRLSDGRTSHRDVVFHPGAVALVVKHRTTGDYLFIKQYRKAAEQLITEIVAGTLEAGEDIALCATRELREEGGFEPVLLEHYGALYPSPGYLSERIELFYAEVEGDPHPLELDHDEQLEPTWMSEAAFEAAVANGEIVDAKTLGAWLRYTVWRKTTHA